MKKEYFPHTICRFIVVFCMCIIMCLSVSLHAAPHLGDTFDLKQPDGSRVTVKAWGDEYYQRIESIDGYSLIRNEHGWICYAEVSDDGNEFVATDIVYEGNELIRTPVIKQYLVETRGLRKGLRINAASRREKALKRRDQLSGLTSEQMLAAPEEVARIEAAESMTSFAPLTGSVVGLTILVDFNDVPATIPVSEIDDYCNLPGYTGYSNNGSVYDYYYDVSNGLLEYTNLVTDYYRAEYNKPYYDDCVDNKTIELIDEALNWLDDHGFDFTALSTDADNRILALNVFYAGSPDCGWAKGLWPHASAYYEFTSSSGVKSGRYQITNIGSSLMLRTFCHENGHMICGYPDLYDYGYESNGIGNYGLMAYGGSSTNPVPPNPYLRDIKGWETTIEISGDTPGTIREHLANSFTTYRYSHPTLSNEYFLIESRLKTGRNAALPDEGLLIWHIDETGSNNNEQMTPELHYQVSVEQADGLFGLENRTSYGDSGDLFHADYKDSFSDTTLPDAKWWDGTDSGLDISNISEVGSTMSFALYAVESYSPVADSNDVSVTDPNGVVIHLNATDDVLPIPPGKLSTIISSLPVHGWLFDPNDGLEIVTTPYTLQNDGNSVIYEPCRYYFTGDDTFTWKANDGGIAPDGGDSNIADINITMNMLLDTSYEVHTNKNDPIPFHTSYKKVRCQAIYHADELGGTAQTILNLALNIETVPDPNLLQDWTIRMKHTSMSAYESSGNVFDNGEDWTVVYDANESITETGWHDFEFHTPFDYDPDYDPNSITTNLLIDFSFNNDTNISNGRVYTSEMQDDQDYRIIWQRSNLPNDDPLEFEVPHYLEYRRLFNLQLKVRPDTEILVSDFNTNCSVDMNDMITMVNTWLAQKGDLEYDSACDISEPKDNKVNLADFTILSLEWLNEL